MKRWTILAAVAAALITAGLAIAGTTGLQSILVVRSSAANPTCATSTGDGYICAENGIESEGVLNVAGASTLTGNTAVGGTLAVTGTTTLTGATSIASLSSFVITAGSAGASCTVGSFMIDTDSTVELCYCGATNTYWCWDRTTADGPKD